MFEIENGVLLKYSGNEEVVVIPSGVKIINKFAFYECLNMKIVVIPEGVIEICKYAFDRCNNLNVVYIPSTLEKINEYSFLCLKIVEVYNLSSIDICKVFNIKNSVKVIHKSLEEKSSIVKKDGFSFIFNGTDYYLFDYPKNTKIITLPSDVDGNSYHIICDAFINDSNIVEVIISNGVKTIGASAFMGCTNLEKIIISESVEEIGSMAFGLCYKLVDIYNFSKVEIDEFVFGYIEYDHEAVVVHDCMEPSAVITLGDYVFLNKDNEYYLIGYEGNETDIILPDNILGRSYKIKYYAFYNNLNINSVVISNGVTCIGSNAFSCCEKLKNIEISESVTSIGIGAFRNCNKLKEIKIPKKVSYIGYAAFACEDIRKIFVDVDNKTYDSRNNCNGIIETSTNKLIVGCQNTVIPNDITIIDEEAFYFSNLRKISIPKNVSEIGDNAFYPGDYLKDIYYEGDIEGFNKMLIGDCNDSFFTANFYCHTNMNFDSENKNIDIKKVELEKYPKTYEEVLNLDNDKLYELSGKILEIENEEDSIDIMFENYNKWIHLKFYDNQMLDNVNLCVGSTITLLGSICYEVGYEMIVFIAKNININR